MERRLTRVNGEAPSLEFGYEGRRRRRPRYGLVVTRSSVRLAFGRAPARMDLGRVSMRTDMGVGGALYRCPFDVCN